MPRGSKSDLRFGFERDHIHDSRVMPAGVLATAFRLVFPPNPDGGHIDEQIQVVVGFRR